VRASGVKRAVAPAAPSPRADARRSLRAAEALAARLPPLSVATSRVAADVATGAHGRRHVGPGEAFWQFRRREPGDPSTAIDWRRSARSEHLFVREREWETAQSVHIRRDASASMNWRSGFRVPTKRERADLLTLALAALLIRGGERVGLIGVDGPPARDAAGLERLAEELGRQLEPVVPEEHPLPRHARVVILGDFLAPIEAAAKSVAELTARGVRGHLVQIVDPAEETLPFEGRVEFQGVEGEGDVLVSRVGGVRDAYLRRFAAHREALREIARRSGWTFAAHRTDEPPRAALLDLWNVLSLGGE